MKTLKEIYGLHEMAINVPDGDVAALRKVIRQAILSGDLPGEAMAWIPRKAKGTSDKEVPKAEPSTPPKKGTKKAGVKGPGTKEPEASVREPIALDPGLKADLDRSQSAWDRLGQRIADPGVPLKSKVRSEPMKGPEFEPMGIHPDYDMPNLGTPRSANVRLNRKGQPERDRAEVGPDMFASVKRPGMLSRLFKKKVPSFDVNPYEFEPEQPPKVPKPIYPDLSKFFDGEDGSDQSPGKDAIDDLRDFLGGSLVPRRGRSGGDDAMRDLEWDLKRSRGKR